MLGQNEDGGLGVTLPWGGEDRHFRLGIGQWRAIQATCDAGPEEIAARLAPTARALEAGLNATSAIGHGLTGRWRLDDVREVIMQGLMGGNGGLDAIAVTRLMNTWFDARHLRSNALVAFTIVMASLEGLPTDAPVGEAKGDGQPTPSPEARSSSATSTAAAGEPDLIPDPSTG